MFFIETRGAYAEKMRMPKNAYAVKIYDLFAIFKKAKGEKCGILQKEVVCGNGRMSKTKKSTFFAQKMRYFGRYPHRFSPAPPRIFRAAHTKRAKSSR